MPIVAGSSRGFRSWKQSFCAAAVEGRSRAGQRRELVLLQLGAPARIRKRQRISEGVGMKERKANKMTVGEEAAQISLEEKREVRRKKPQRGRGGGEEGAGRSENELPPPRPPS